MMRGTVTVTSSRSGSLFRRRETSTSNAGSRERHCREKIGRIPASPDFERRVRGDRGEEGLKTVELRGEGCEVTWSRRGELAHRSDVGDGGGVLIVLTEEGEGGRKLEDVSSRSRGHERGEHDLSGFSEERPTHGSGSFGRGWTLVPRWWGLETRVQKVRDPSGGRGEI
jgi:hypothetical protein